MSWFERGALRKRLPTMIGMLLIAAPALAGGTGDNILIIIDPSRAESLYVGNYYKAARNVPDSNVLYMRPEAANFASFAGPNIDGLLGTLRQRGINQNIDYVIVTPGAPFFLPAPNLVGDGCSQACMSFLCRKLIHSAVSKRMPKKCVGSEATASELTEGWSVALRNSKRMEIMSIREQKRRIW